MKDLSRITWAWSVIAGAQVLVWSPLSGVTLCRFSHLSNSGSHLCPADTSGLPGRFPPQYSARCGAISNSILSTGLSLLELLYKLAGVSSVGRSL